ncbi:MAG: hypothetical protein AAFR61_29880 [Bacteroidota bacterium]
MTREYEYQFPEQDSFRAMEVTEQDFDILSDPKYEDLYVDFSAVRSADQFKQMDFMLGMKDGQFARRPNAFHKIIFSGHRGCGKTIELQRYTRQINTPEAYMAIYVNLEEETDILQFSSEDLFVLLISILLRELDQRGIPFERDDFEQISEEWVQESEVTKELEKAYGMEAEAGVSLGWKFWQFLGIEGKFKGIFSQKNITTEVIRNKIRIDQKNLITKLNVALYNIEQVLAYENQGQGLIFVIDGLEKAHQAVYDQLFLLDPQLMMNLNAHVVACVPIRTFYEIQRKDLTGTFESVYLPMIRLSPKSKPLLSDLIARRVSLELFEGEILDRIIDMSGGCPRQLLRLVHRSFIVGLGKKIDHVIADKTFQEQGLERWRTLTSEHKALIEHGEFDDADSMVLDLLFSLNLLEYNGENPERKINPLLASFFS